MPRRNRRPKSRPIPSREPEQELTLDQVAIALVKAGKAPSTILGPRSWSVRCDSQERP